MKNIGLDKCMDALVVGTGLFLALSTHAVASVDADGDVPFFVSTGERFSSAAGNGEAFPGDLPARNSSWTFRHARELLRNTDYRDVPFTVGSRKEWNARPITEPYEAIQAVKGIVIHQSETTEGTSLRSIQEYHQRVKKWADIGYHFVIALDANRQWKIFQARPLDAKGAHVGRRGEEDLNIGEIGICLMGDFDQPDNPERMPELPPAERARRGKMPHKPENLLQADPRAVYLLGQLVDQLMIQYGSQVKKITGHGAGDHAAFPGHKSCPGQGSYHLVEALRSRYGMDSVDRTRP